MLTKQLKDLTANPQNPRQISDKKLKMLKKSLAEFGDLSGIVFNKKTGRLVGGHQRMKVLPPDAKIHMDSDTHGHVMIDGDRFSYREVEWDETKEKAANIAANKHGGEWDLPQLSDWLLDLDSMNIDMELTGFDKEELEGLMAPVNKIDPQCDEDEVPSVPKEPITKRGDIWLLGGHVLMCGDSTSIDDVEKLMAGERADMVFTDPPYGIEVVGGGKAFGKVGGGNIIESNTYMRIKGDDTTQTAVDAYNLCAGLSIPVLCFWGANYYASALPDRKSWIFWDKETTGNFSDGELAWTSLEGRVRRFKHVWNGLIKESEKRDKRVHPTQKPIALAEWCFQELNPEGKVVLDLFGGSGSTLIACEKTNRQCLMMEFEPHYCDVIVARWEKYTGKKAELLTHNSEITAGASNA